MRSAVPTLLAAALAAACSDATSIPPASFNNVVDTVTVYAISGTRVYDPSGYAMTERRPVRLDNTTSADFGYDRTPDGRDVLLPGAMLGHPGSAGIDPGLLATDEEFSAITVAQVNGYKTLDTVAVAVGDVFYLRSRIPRTCYLGVPTYGKLEVLSVDVPNHTITFQVLGNLNCGYKSLTPGLPAQ